MRTNSEKLQGRRRELLPLVSPRDWFTLWLNTPEDCNIVELDGIRFHRPEGWSHRHLSADMNLMMNPYMACRPPEGTVNSLDWAAEQIKPLIDAYAEVPSALELLDEKYGRKR
jgi:hypothetical protein